MSWISKTFSSSIGRKIIMSLTGLFLCSFLLVHLLINLQMLRHDGGATFNFWAEFMGTNPVIRFMEIILMLGLALHSYQGLALALKNKKARGAQGYVVNHPEQNSQWSSRNMALLGTLLLIFLIVHLMNFWVRSRFDAMGGLAEVKVPNLDHPVGDLYSVAAASFKIPWYVALYAAAQLALGYHLWHGFRSGFQTLGLNHRKYSPAIRSVGYTFAVVVSLLFAVIPVVMFFSSEYQPRPATGNTVEQSLSAITHVR
ncbi:MULTISPECIES: succinate dehydrogenase cytochrome b subunit [Hymenobacter]|uniref:Succinate dehydrogenase cytochrome b subunit n=1 Tax=Hymenobacter jejuensis TaxID=2502781 RepID=A0A5B7ZX40_9BACT|nr:MULTISPECIES: succinate dehydrogenase cytochrome b subunit [Hymenobacter]MBC6988626.1 succinate dehydrogenase cytochrome b subunit [Hymenobacter sp. BT491]QDA59076.1 succinate dehydrogenase cytochrome b subunit [Hymenobacter jejuensis]